MKIERLAHSDHDSEVFGHLKLEIKINSTWGRVTYFIFRSWSGERRVNGRSYHGPVRYLGSTKLARLRRTR